jgi:hypothetical protein
LIKPFIDLRRKLAAGNEVNRNLGSSTKTGKQKTDFATRTRSSLVLQHHPTDRQGCGVEVEQQPGMQLRCSEIGQELSLVHEIQPFD